MTDRDAGVSKEVLPYNRDFLLEEYRVKWEYLRFLETARESLVKWYATTIGVLLSVAFGVQPASPWERLRPLRPAILTFAVLYSIFVVVYVLIQKRNYSYYHDRVEAIEKACGTRDCVGRPPRFLSASRVYLAFPAGVGAGLLGLLVDSLGANVVLAAFVGCGAFVLAMALSWAKAFRS